MTRPVCQRTLFNRALRAGLGAVLLSAGAAFAQAPGEDWQTRPVPPVSAMDGPKVAVLRGLEKVTARVRELEVPVGQPVRFGPIEVTVRYCESTPPTEPPETAAFLDIDDYKLDGSVERVFSGWMFASSPALNPLEHPVYDVWVMNCKAASPETVSPIR